MAHDNLRLVAIEERAAILAYEHGLPREQAEARARAERAALFPA